MAIMPFSSLQSESSGDNKSTIDSVPFDVRAKLEGHENVSVRFLVATPTPHFQDVPHSCPLPFSSTNGSFSDSIFPKKVEVPKPASSHVPAWSAYSKDEKHIDKPSASLRCPFENCSKRFTRASDLQLHGESSHIKYLCFLSGCPREVIGYCRKEKLNEHIRKRHPSFFSAQGKLKNASVRDSNNDRAEHPRKPEDPYSVLKDVPFCRKKGRSSSVGGLIPNNTGFESDRSGPSNHGQSALPCKETELETLTNRTVSSDIQQTEQIVEENQIYPQILKPCAIDIASNEHSQLPISCQHSIREVTLKQTNNIEEESLVPPRTSLSRVAESDEWSDTDSETETNLGGSDLYNYLFDTYEGSLLDKVMTPIPEASREALIERLMDEFWMVFNHEWSPCMTQTAGSLPSSPDGPRRQTTVTASSSNEHTRHKRKKDEDDNENLDRRNGDDQGDSPSKKLRITNPKRNFQFACPFRKHDPTKYNVVDHRICALNPWENIARLKEHLYRKHMAAPYCERCWQAFENSDQLRTHVQLPKTNVCEAVAGSSPEGITPEQERFLKRKRKSYAEQSEESRWREIYRTLFPGESVPLTSFDPPREQTTTISTPNSQSLDQYESYMRERLPELIRSRVEQYIDASLFRGLDFGAMIRECQEELSRSYRATETESGMNQTQALEPRHLVQNTTTFNPMLGTSTNLPIQPRRNVDFVSEILRVPSPQPDSRVLDPNFEAAVRDSRDQRIVDQCSDSGYGSKNTCACSGDCNHQRTNPQPVAYTSNSNHPATIISQFDSALSLQSASHEAASSNPWHTSYTPNHHALPLDRSIDDPCRNSIQQQQRTFESEHRSPNLGLTSLPGEVYRSFDVAPQDQYRPEIIAAPLYHCTDLSLAPTARQYNDGSVFQVFTPRGTFQNDDAFDLGLFDVLMGPGIYQPHKS